MNRSGLPGPAAAEPDPNVGPRPDNGARITRVLLGPVEMAIFENAYVAHASEARDLARAFLADAAMAQDAVHDAFLEILRFLLSGRRWAGPDQARAVVLRNTRWAALKRLRSRRRQAAAALPAGQEDDPVAWARSEARALCEEVVGGLRSHYREALRLHYVEDVPDEVAARRLGLTLKGYQRRIDRALSAARRVIGARGEGAWRGMLPLSLHRARRPRRPPQRDIPRGASLLGGWAPVLGVGTALLVASVSSHPGSASAPTSVRPSPGVLQPGLPRDSIDQTVVTGATGVLSGRDRIIVAIGRGPSCRCWLVFRSVNAGETWQTAPGPPAVSAYPRVVIPQGYPQEGRLDVIDGSGGSLERWSSPGWGRGFSQAAAGTALPLGSASAIPCSTVASSHSACPQRLLRSGAGFPGWLVPLSRKWLLYLRGDEGLLCSVDGGRDWGASCAGA